MRHKSILVYTLLASLCHSEYVPPGPTMDIYFYDAALLGTRQPTQDQEQRCQAPCTFLTCGEVGGAGSPHRRLCKYEQKECLLPYVGKSSCIAKATHRCDT